MAVCITLDAEAGELPLFEKKTNGIAPHVDFPSLRVFDISEGHSSWENKHIRNIGSWSQLRYLRIQHVEITVLPEDIGKLQNLETLDLRGSCIRELPSTIAWLQKLVRLFIHHRQFVFSADMFGSMRALEEVSDICKVDNPKKFLEDVGYLTKLRKISMSELFRSEDFECYRERLRSSLNKLCKYSLQYLHIDGDMGNIIFRDPCCTFPHLQHLELVCDMERVPKGLASLTNLLKLDIAVSRFDEEGLHILMGMPSLAYVQLRVSLDGTTRPMTVSSNGFKLLEVFHFHCNISYGELGIEFAAGAMPALRRLHLFWRASICALRSSNGAGMGIQHLSSLEQLHVVTCCADAIPEEVEALEGRVGKTVTLHPNRQTLQFRLHRKNEYSMYKDEEERKRVVECNCTTLEGSVEKTVTHSILNRQILVLEVRKSLKKHEEERGRQSARLEENAQEQQEDQVI